MKICKYDLLKMRLCLYGLCTTKCICNPYNHEYKKQTG